VSRFVLDASVALSWFVDRPIAPLAARVRQLLSGGERAIVPALWHLEVANGFVVAQRRRVLTQADLAEALSHLDRLLVSAIESSNDLIPVSQAARAADTLGLSAYDGVYLELARQEGIPLATLDVKLKGATRRAGVALVQ
jgi:predicted nucleic acid-binding protein